jgi:hypothetical protein
MQNLLLPLFIMTVLIWCFFRRSKQHTALPAVPPASEAPHHANGYAMTIREVHVWRSMQQVISAHWPELSTLSDTNVRSYRSADGYWGGVIQVYGIAQVALRSDIGNWEAEISSEGRVEAPHEKM